MNKFSMNDIDILKCFEQMGIRHKNPCAVIHLMDNLQKHYHMSRDEAIKSLEFLGQIDYLEGNGQFLSLTEHFDMQLYEKKGETMGKSYTLDIKKATRFRMLEKIYDETGGSENTIINIHDVGAALNLPPDLNEITSEYLVGERLIEFKALGGFVAITHYGIQQYEQSISAPEKESKYFPPVNIIKNIIKIEKADHLQIQAGTINSTQTLNKSNDFDELKIWLQKLEETLISENKQELLNKMEDDIEIIKANINTERPNKKYIGIALNAIKDILTGITSNIIFHELLSKLPYLIP